MVNTYPNLYLVGAPKCGTTSLFQYFSSHPSVYTPSFKKEPNYFNFDLTKNMTGICDKERYLSIYSNWASETYALDASVWYLFSKRAAQLIHKASPNAKIVVALRNPSSQMISLHAQRYASGNEDIEDPREAFHAESDRRRGKRIPKRVHIESGLLYSEVANYPPQLKRYFDIFGRENVYVIILEEFINNPRAEYGALCQFLDIAPNFPRSFLAHNAYKQPRIKLLPKHLRSLRSVPFLRMLFRLLIPSFGARTLLGEKIMRLNYKYVKKPGEISAIESELAPEMSDVVRETEELLGRNLPWTAS